MLPALKKRLSYEKDGRNVLAESRALARKAIRKRKAKASRALRRAQTVAMATLEGGEAELAVTRTGARSWRKIADAPLAQYVAQPLVNRGIASKGSGLRSMASKRARYRRFVCKGPLNPRAPA
ncbi:hypothetical protein [Massilia sp. CF038]|uniref:hypothetical protein n=1 Tax=Massilia sp. CF038 TaxID=1881045 RepID=UPI00091DD4F9|nr:hypothetical protein [Massilia sp. CF038]SHG53459.1 hypothetical protein SAMN05428948_0911 [Massilia sp. CF038]